MRLLILGGTVFLGRALTDAALARGHSVTHMHRGVSAGRDSRVETLIADRASAPFLGDADPARTWDAVLDTSGYLPQVVRLSVEALRDRVGRYAFVSSISAYRSFESAPIDEDAPLQSPPDPLPDAMTPELYGALKAGCEAVAGEAFGDRALIVRPGLIVGPHDASDRFTWWPWRIAQGGPFAAAGRPDRAVQLIDVRDLAEWMVAMLQRGMGGTFNATGPGTTLTMSDVVRACRAAAPDAGAAPLWMSDEFLLRHDVKPWIEIPLWVPESDASLGGLMDVDIGRALAEGLSFRALSRTVEDTLAWARERPADHRWKAGLAREREEMLLAAWRQVAR
jgi:2'-hydroxyisoflavone reductase